MEILKLCIKKKDFRANFIYNPNVTQLLLVYIDQESFEDAYYKSIMLDF